MDLLGDITLLKASRVSSCFLLGLWWSGAKMLQNRGMNTKKRESVSQDGIKIMAALRRTTESVELVGNSWCVYFISFTSCWPMPCSWSYFPSFRLRVGRISLFHQNNPIVRRGARGITVYPLIRLPAGGGESGDDEPHCSPYLSVSLSLSHTNTHIQ